MNAPRSTLPRYTLCSGFHHNPERNSYAFFPTWLDNTLRMFDPVTIFIIADSGADDPVILNTSATGPIYTVLYNWIRLTGDCGSCGALLNGSKKNAFNGWSAAVLTAAALCYANETDFIWKEQDCLCFGDCLDEMYRQIGPAGIIHGDFRHSKGLIMPAAQSLFLVRHHFIPHFMRQLLMSGPQNVEDRLGEHIFARLGRMNPSTWRVFDFGYDRGRPINFDAPTWYGQYWTPEELAELKKRALI